jgi:flagellar hook-associated protein 3 FlgL
MSFRITGNMMFKRLLSNVRTTTSTLGKLQEQMVSLRRINRPSDDPSGASQVAALRVDEADYKQYMTNIDSARGMLDFSASVLETMSEEMVAVRGKLMAAINPTSGPNSRDVAAIEIDHILNSIVDQANSSYAGTFVFGGTQTQSPPFEIEARGIGGIETVSYGGDSGKIRYIVGTDHHVEVNEDPVEVFMPRGEALGVFQSLIGVRKLLQNPDDLGTGELGKQLSENLSVIDDIHDDIVRALGRVGTRSRALQIRHDLYSKAQLSAVAQRSEIEDADVADVALRLQNQQVIFQVVLAGSAAVYSSNLMEFLR